MSRVHRLTIHCPKISRPRISRPRIGILGLICGLVLLNGCGYALVGLASNIPEDIQKIYVAPLDNATSRSQVEQILTRAVSDELLTRRRYETVNTAAEADAVLSGTVIAFNVRPVTFDTDGLANAFEVAISANMKFARTPGATGEEEIIWSNSRYVFRQDYPLEDGEGGAYFDRENIAIENTSERFAKTLVTDLLEGF